MKDVVFGPDGSMLATSGNNGELRIWNPATGELLAEYVEPGDYVEPAGRPDAILGDVNRRVDRDALDHFVWGLSISPTGDRVAAVWGLERLRIIDAATGRALVETDVSVHGLNTFRTAFSPDGRRIAVPMEGDRPPAILDARTGTQLRSLESGGDSFVWSPDGRWLAAARGAEALIYDAATGRLRFTLVGHIAEVRALDWTADSTRLATGSEDGTVRIWDVDVGGVRETLVLSSRGLSAGVNGVAFSADGSQVMAGEEQSSRVLVWDIDDIGGGEWAAMPSSEWSPLAAASDGRHVLTSGPKRAVTQWDPRTGAKVREFGDDQPAAMVAGGGGLVAAVSGDSPRAPSNRRLSTLTVWDAATGAERFARTFVTYVVGDVVGVDVNADGRLVATTTEHGPALILDRDGNQQAALDDGDLRRDLAEDHVANAVALGADGTRAAVAQEPILTDGTGVVQVWDVARREVLHTLEVRSDSVDFGADGRLLAVAQDDDATVWDVSDGTLVTTLTGHLVPVRSASFDRQGTTVATTSRDGTVRLWDARTGLPRLGPARPRR